MDEMLLHYFWKNRIISKYHLQTTDERKLIIVDPGFPHRDAGPDFKQAIIKLDGFTWVGDVEIHVNASDWFRHGHQNDAKYQSLILHVVFRNDVDIGANFPTLELKDYIAPQLIAEYEGLSLSQELLPCRSELENVTSLQFASWLSRLMVTRLERRQEEFFTTLHLCHDSWQEAVFRCLVSNFGFRTNAPAFELLAKSIPYRILLKHKDSRLQIYALFFGQGGFLDDDLPGDDYYQTLQSEYSYLRFKYNLISIPLKIWNLLRLRPQNFPCIRIAQLCECLYRIPDIIELIISGEDIAQFSALSDFEPHPYWKTHRHFGKESASSDSSHSAKQGHSCLIGKQTVSLLIINTVVPVRFSYASFRGDEASKEKCLELLENLAYEQNAITKQYAVAGFPHETALESQAILELNHHYCVKKRCIQCEIGNKIITNRS